MPDDLDATPWIVGWIVGGGVVVLVAALVLTLIGVGRSIEGQAQRITSSLARARPHAAGMWRLTETNRLLEDSAHAARTARIELGGAGSSGT